MKTGNIEKLENEWAANIEDFKTASSD